MSSNSASAVIKRDVVTPVTAIVFIAIGVTGVMLFFHLNEGWIKTGHEWLGLVFVVAALWHLVRHWRGFLGYFKRKGPMVALVASLVLSLGVIGFTARTDDDGGFSPRSLIHAMEVAPLSEAAAVMGVTPSDLTALLADRGWSGAGPDASAEEVGAANGLPAMAVLAALGEVGKP